MELAQTLYGVNLGDAPMPATVATVATVTHPTLGVMTIEGEVLGDDSDGAVYSTLRRMEGLLNKAASSPTAMDTLITVADQCGLQEIGRGDGHGISPVQYTANVWAWVKARVQFTTDAQLAQELGLGSESLPVQEIVWEPDALAQRALAVDSGGPKPKGDCDDYSTLVAMLLTLGAVPCAFVVVAGDGQSPDQYSHVYVAAYPLGYGRVAVDSSHGPVFGAEARNMYGKRREWSLSVNGLPTKGESEGGLIVEVLGFIAASMAVTTGLWAVWNCLTKGTR